MCLSSLVAFNFFQFWAPKIFFCGSVDPCIPYSRLLTKAFYFFVTLCRSLRNFPWAAWLKPRRSGVIPTSIALSFFLSLLHMHAFTYSIYSWQMQSSSLAKGFQKKSLCHDYPFQLLLTLSLERFPTKDYWGLMLLRKIKKKILSFFFFNQKKKQTLNSQTSKFPRQSEHQETRHCSELVGSVFNFPLRYCLQPGHSSHTTIVFYKVFYTFININRDSWALKPYVLLWGHCLDTCLN